MTNKFLHVCSVYTAAIDKYPIQNSSHIYTYKSFPQLVLFFEIVSFTTLSEKNGAFNLIYVPHILFY